MNELSDRLNNILFYKSPIINTKQILYADATATGRPCKYIEQKIQEDILPYYANTHSNAYCGIMMKNKIKDTKNIIRKQFNLCNDKKIIFVGSGSTAAVNRIVNCLSIDKLPKVHIFLSLFEHHSNYLPWIKLTNAHIHLIPINSQNDIDFDWLEEQLDEINKDNNEHVCIVSITACSNVTGVFVDTDRAWNIVNKSNRNCTTKCKLTKPNILLLDYACNAPYVNIDGTKCDAFYFSPHKFLGGVGTPGVLVADRCLFINKVPVEPGGGCVQKVCSTAVIYDNDIEKRESAGTPNIMGIIKIGEVLKLKNLLFEKYIHPNDMFLAKYVFSKFNDLIKKHTNMKVVLSGEHLEKRLPIVCIDIDNMHYNYVVVLLNDLYGIQSRGGVSCAGVFAEWLNKKYNIKGWCRITFSWYMKMSDVDYIINAVNYICENGNKYKDMYSYDKNLNLFVKKTM